MRFLTPVEPGEIRAPTPTLHPRQRGQGYVFQLKGFPRQQSLFLLPDDAHSTGRHSYLSRTGRIHDSDFLEHGVSISRGYTAKLREVFQSNRAWTVVADTSAF